jgi:general secretion pathway protein I
MNMTAAELPHAGFTLIEVMVALFIVSLSLMAGLRAASSLTSNADRQWLMLLAQICADNTLVQLRLAGQFIDVGEHTRACPQAGRDLRVVLSVSTTPNPSFRRVDAQVLEAATPLLRVSGLAGRY